MEGLLCGGFCIATLERRLLLKEDIEKAEKWNLSSSLSLTNHHLAYLTLTNQCQHGTKSVSFRSNQPRAATLSPMKTVVADLVGLNTHKRIDVLTMYGNCYHLNTKHYVYTTFSVIIISSGVPFEGSSRP